MVKALRLGALSALACASLSVGRANVGGGPGTPLSPYSKLSEDDISPSLVQAKKKAAAGKRVILSLPIVQRETMVERIAQLGLAFVKDERIQGEVTHELLGVSEDGKELSVPFSEISSLEVLGHDDGKLVVELRRFPAIEPEELLRRKPTYLELRKEYTKSALLRVVVTNQSGATLHLIGQKVDRKPESITPLAKIAPGRTVVFLEALFDREAYWWAIPSVTKDPAYPYRVIERK